MFEQRSAVTASDAAPRALSRVLGATLVGGGAAYILTVWAGIRLGADYTPFALFWSALYLVVGALSGVQQEITRATRRLEPGETAGVPVARNFAVATAGLVAVLALATAPAWAGAVFGGSGWALVLPLTLGVASYVVVAVLSGVFYGMSLWTAVAGMIALDGVTRLVLTGVLLFVTRDPAVLAWAVIAPFVLVPVITWLVVRRRVVGAFRLDVGYRRLAGNVAKTVVGALATGVLVSGFPLFVGATSASVPPARLAALLFVITVARAPLIIVVLSLQSYFVIRFRDAAGRLLAVVLKLLGLIAAGAAAIALVAGLVGPWLLDNVVGGMSVEGPMIAAVVASGGLIAALCVTGPAALSRSRHTEAAAGWLVAAAVTVVTLLLPVEFGLRVLLAAYLGPLAGLAVHIVALRRGGAAQPVGLS